MFITITNWDSGQKSQVGRIGNCTKMGFLSPRSDFMFTEKKEEKLKLVKIEASGPLGLRYDLGCAKYLAAITSKSLLSRRTASTLCIARIQLISWLDL